jgi:O-antigen/teichoic acid export membrane protein
MKPSIRKNFIYNNIYTLTTIAVPLITYPYLTRILGPIGIGKFSFLTSYTNYFVLLSSLGLPIYGVREIAKVRDNKVLLDKTFSELFVLNFIMSIFVFFLLGLSLSFPSILSNENKMKYFSLAFLSISFLKVDWLFKGLEKYNIITLINIFTRVGLVVSIFYFINAKTDYWIYYAITVAAHIILSILFFVISLKHVNIKFSNLNFNKHLRPLFLIFASVLAISVYDFLDMVILGYISTASEVGFYTVSMKVVRITLSIVTSLSVVIMPRMSYYLKKNDIKAFYDIFNNSIHFISLISLPALIGIILLAPNIIGLFAGDSFIPAINLLICLAFLIIIIGYSNLLGTQLLIPSGKEKYYLYCVSIGAFINLLLNFILIPHYNALGAVVATLISAISVFLASLYYSQKDFKIIFPFKYILLHLMASLSFIPISSLIKVFVNSSSNLYFFIMISSCMTAYFTIIIIFRDRLVIENLKIFREKYRF